MNRIISYIKFLLISLSIFFYNTKFVLAEENNRIIERSASYVSIIIFTLLAVITLFTFFSFIYLFLRQLNIEWDFQKEDKTH